MNQDSNSRTTANELTRSSFVYTNQMNIFDPNLGSTGQYSSPTSPSANHHEQMPLPTSTEDSIASAAAVPTADFGCVTYSNVVFVPNNRSTNDMNANTSELREDNSIAFVTSDSQFPYKYVVSSSESRFFGTYSRSESLENDNVGIESSFIGDTGDGVLLSNHSNLNDFANGENNQHEMLIQADHQRAFLDVDYSGARIADQEIILQCANGQLYRQVQNVAYVNHSEGGNSIEFVPALISESMNGDLNEYETQSQLQYQQFDQSGSQISENNRMNDEMTYGNYRNHEQLTHQKSHEYSMNNVTAAVETNERATNVSEKDHQRILLESAMSPLLAAVNITSRDEQYQSYLAQSRHNNSKESANELFRGCDMNGDNTRVSCATPIEEYVDINEMEFIKTQGTGKQGDNNVLMHRSKRKKSTKKGEELTIVDKPVPIRAYASLPSTYLMISEDETNVKAVFAKRNIPLRTQFGPFEGDVKAINSDEQMSAYRANRVNAPLLFLDESKVLDVSNEKTSNWMRFVDIARNYVEQNLLLLQSNGKLYFKSCKFIAPKQRLRVGYSREYANKFGLPTFARDEGDKAKKSPIEEKKSPKEPKEIEKIEVKPTTRIKHTPTKKPESGSTASTPTKKNHRLNTGAIRRRKLALSKICKTTGPTVRYACCYCSKVFSKFLSYKKHTNNVHRAEIDSLKASGSNENGKLLSPSRMNALKNITEKCFQSEPTVKTPVATAKSPKEIEKSIQCEICLKQLMSPSALTMHMRAHNAKQSGIFRCPFCAETYKNTLLFKEHVKVHMENGKYFCPHCQKEFEKYSSVRKHIQLNHSTMRFACQECGKDFKSRYKLKEHSLKHSDVRQFQCDDCGKQFKRKDKLREHILRVHATSSSASTKMVKQQSQNVIEMDALSTSVAEEIVIDDTKSSKFIPHVSPSEYQRFIYKCNNCMIGFKRRGMLVNQMAKHHPDVSVDTVPELSLPILQTQRCYYCQYCDKMYRSSSKRKAHILKYHPGQELPQSMRRKDIGDTVQMQSNRQDMTYSEDVGSIAIHAQRCPWCHKQYASKTRLQQHKRKQHANELNSNDDTMTNSRFPFESENQMYGKYFGASTMTTAMSTTAATTMEFPSYNRVPEAENKLLKLSSAALDFQFINREPHRTDLTKNECNYSEFGEATTTNCDLNPLPQLFEGI